MVGDEMIKIWNCRRSMLALIGMCLMTYLGVHNNLDVSMALAGVITAIAGSNAAESIFKK